VVCLSLEEEEEKYHIKLTVKITGKVYKIIPYFKEHIIAADIQSAHQL
jgi:hypothetical protein